jgi:hypothetical protein
MGTTQKRIGPSTKGKERVHRFFISFFFFFFFYGQGTKTDDDITRQLGGQEKDKNRVCHGPRAYQARRRQELPR